MSIEISNADTEFGGRAIISIVTRTCENVDNCSEQYNKDGRV